MYIIGATETQIAEAVERTNVKYGYNLRYEISPSHLEESGLKLSVHVIDDRGPGHRLSHPAIHGGRPMNLPSACWHVYYDIFQNLPSNALIQKDKILYKVSNQKYPVWTEDNGNFPINITELCECVTPKRFPNPLRGEKWQDLYPKTQSSNRRKFGIFGRY